MVKKLLIALVVAVFCVGVSGNNADMDKDIVRNDLKISPQWKLPNIMGRNFWMLFRITLLGKDMSDRNVETCLHRPGAHYPLEKTPEGIRKLGDIPAFHDVAVKYHIPFYSDLKAVNTNPDGSCSVFLPRIADKTRPFFIDEYILTRLWTNPYAEGSRYYRKPTSQYEAARQADYHRFFFGKYKNDPKVFAKWKQEHPNFVLFGGCSEWFHESSPLFERRLRGAGDAVSQQEIDNIRKEYLVPPKGEKFTLDMRIARGRKLLERGGEILFDDIKNTLVFEGCSSVAHLEGYFGTGMTGIETSRPWQMWQNQMINVRGAARQFQQPWVWYIASFNFGYDINGKSTSRPYYGRCEPSWSEETIKRKKRAGTYAPLSGLSHNLINRVFYLAYLNGATFIEREDGVWLGTFYASLEQGTLTPEGKNYVEFYNFTRKYPERGTPFTPIALLRPAKCISARNGTCFPEGKMDNAFLATIYRMFPDEYMKSKVPGFQYEDLSKFENPHDGVKKTGFEMGLANTAPYGDLFDALTPDFEDQTSFKRILPAYDAAILTGHYMKNPEMAKILTDYVKNGGTLIINTQQLNSDYSSALTGIELTGKTIKSGDYVLDGIKLAGAEVVYKDKEDNPLFTRNCYGQGAVIVTTPQYMIPSQPSGYGKFHEDAMSGKLKFPYVKKLLEMVCSEVNPVKVDGDVGFGLNKTPTGWWLYLFNNKGVMKLEGKEQWFDMNRVVKVKIDFNRLRPKSITELRTGKKLVAKNNKLTLEINPGDFKILELKVFKKSE